MEGKNMVKFLKKNKYFIIFFIVVLGLFTYCALNTFAASDDLPYSLFSNKKNEKFTNLYFKLKKTLESNDFKVLSFTGVLGESRTRALTLRRGLFYPTKLRGHISYFIGNKYFVKKKERIYRSAFTTITRINDIAADNSFLKLNPFS